MFSFKINNLLLHSVLLTVLKRSCKNIHPFFKPSLSSLCIYEPPPVRLCAKSADSSLVLLANSSGSPQATPPAVLIGHPGPKEVRIGAPPAVTGLVLQVELSLQLQGERPVLALLLDLTDVALVKGLLADRTAPLQVRVPVRVQVFGLLLPLLAPSWGRLVLEATVGLLPWTLWVLWH